MVARIGLAVAWTVLGSTLGSTAGCGARPEPRSSVVVYASADDALAREVLAACEAQLGVHIDAVFDTEATKTVGLEQRVRSERERPRADIFWSSEGFAPVRLAREGLLRPIPERIWSSWPEQHRDGQRMWLAFSARARVVVTRSDRALPPVDSWSDLARADATAAGPVAIADPRFGTTNGHLAALDLAWSDARARGVDAPTLEEWLAGIRARGVRVLVGGNAATVESVAAGECAYGLTDTDDALAAIARGLPIRMHVPRTLPKGEPGGGTMVVPNTVALVKGGPGDPGAAERVLAFLVSPECEAMIARSPSRNMPLGVGKVADAHASADPEPGFSENDPLRFDPVAAADGAAARAVRAKRMLEADAARSAAP